MHAIHFPVLHRLKVSDYQLFPGEDGAGIDHTFIHGVTVVAGVNGLGKTTLLNIILRSLIGFYVPSKFNPLDPTAGSHKMVEKPSDYFSSRTANLARGARVEADFVFGRKKVGVVRSLDTMAIVRLTVDGVQAKGDAHELQHAIVAASGLSNLYDFFYVVYSFTFFLEEKVSLIWNPEGQFEIFRVLFLDPATAADLARLAAKITKVQSDYRNRRYHYNRAMDELKAIEDRSGDTSVTAEDLRLRRVDVNTLEEKDEDFARRLGKAIQSRSELLQRITKARLELEEYQRHQEGLLDSFFSRAFPGLPAVVSNVLNHLTAGHGCLVCGTVNPKNHKRYRALAAEGECPFCETKNVKTEKAAVLTGKAENEIARVGAQVADIRATIDTLESALTVTTKEIEQLQSERLTNGAALIAARGEVAKLEAVLPFTTDQLDDRRSKLDSDARVMKQQKRDIEADTAQYAKLLSEGRRAVEAVADVLTKRFSYYAGEFLAEKCSLNYEVEKRPLGEEGEMLEYPNFEVEMTSAVSTKVGTARSDHRHVSESQKEFIDLAFRMALFDAVRQPSEGVMLVIETPEASLDTQFVKKAGAQLRRFAEKPSGSPNLIIATCNLNSAGMVRSLLGVDDLSAKEIRELVPKRLLNLLEIALPNAAVRTYGRQYRDEVKDAISK